MIRINSLNFFFILGIFIIDRLSKILIISLADLNEQFEFAITSFLSFNLIWNQGIAFGLFSFEQKIYYNIITFLIIIVTALVFWMFINTKDLERLGFAMIFGGAISNLFDRIFYTAVPDFIDFHINNFNWFIFNVADIFVSIGVMLLLCLEIFLKKKL